MLAGMLWASGCACGYGGPGCGDPAVFGTCGGEIPIGRSIATVTYFDDTGEHPSIVEHAKAVPEDRLVASTGAEVGGLDLIGVAEGVAELRLSGVEGWEGTTFYYSVKVVAGAVTCAIDEGAVFPDEQSP